MNKLMKRLALLAALLLMLACAATASAALKPFTLKEGETLSDRISVEIPEYIALAKEPYLSTTAQGMTVLNVIVDTDKTKTNWSSAAAHSMSGGIIGSVRPVLHAPKNAGVAKQYSANTGYNFGENNLTTLESLEEALLNNSSEINNSTSVSNGSYFASYSAATGTVTTYTSYNGWENYYQALNVQWLDANGSPVGDAEVLLVNVACDKATSISVSISRVPAGRIYGGVSYSGPGSNAALYDASIVKTTKQDGSMTFVIPDTSKLAYSQVYAAVATPDGKDGWTCTYAIPGIDQSYNAETVTTSSITGSSQTYALLGQYVNQSVGTFSSSYIVTFAKGSHSETMRLDLTAKCGTVEGGKPWLYYTEWKPVTRCALNWTNEDYGFASSLKEPGWYHFEMENPNEMPTAKVMEDPDIYQPYFFRPTGDAVYYKTAGSSIMHNAYFSDVDSKVAEIEKALDKEEFYEAEGPMGAAEYRGVVWPMDPKELELGDGSKTTVYLPSFYAGENTINYTVIRWYDKDKNPLSTEFLLFTTDTFYDMETTKVETTMPTGTQKYPVIVLNHGPQEEYTLVIETYPQDNTDKSAYYELYLIDGNGDRVSFPGKTRMELLLPYPGGYTQEELEALEFAVTHYDSRHNVKESFSKNTIKVQKNGIVIEIFDLSPFMVSWEKGAPAFEVPVSGENTVKVEAELTEDTVAVLPFDEAALASAVGDDQDVALTINLSGLDDAVTTAELPAEVIDMLAEAANDPDHGLTSATIAMPCGVSLNLDAQTLTQLAKLAQDDETVRLNLCPAAQETLSSTQRETVGSRPAFHISLAVDGKSVSKLAGVVTLSAPYALRAGEQADGIVVYYVDEQGGTQACDTMYSTQKKLVTWQTNHFSVYMIDHVTTAQLPQTGDTSHFFLYAFLCSMSLAAIMLLRRKQHN